MALLIRCFINSTLGIHNGEHWGPNVAPNDVRVFVKCSSIDMPRSYLRVSLIALAAACVLLAVATEPDSKVQKEMDKIADNSVSMLLLGCLVC